MGEQANSRNEERTPARYVDGWVIAGVPRCGECGDAITRFYFHGSDILCWACALQTDAEWAEDEARRFEALADKARQLATKTNTREVVEEIQKVIRFPQETKQPRFAKRNRSREQQSRPPKQSMPQGRKQAK